MSALEYQPYTDQAASPFASSHISETFFADISTRVHGENARRLIQPKENVQRVILDFAHDMIPPEAGDIAPLAHLAELSYHDLYGKNIRRSLHESVFSNPELSTEQKLYVGALFSDLSYLAKYAKASHKNSDRTLDLETLAETIKSINIESVALKASLDFSNFKLLKERGELTAKEKQKLERVITSIRHMDSVLLEVLGFDALAAKMLSEVYIHELEQEEDYEFIEAAEQLFDSIGTPEELEQNAETFLTDLFSQSSTMQYRVTHNQNEYDVHFTDGRIILPESNETYRTLTRLKSKGSTAIKMRNTAKKTGRTESPADIIGITFVGADNQSIEKLLSHTLSQLQSKGLDLINAAGHNAGIHIKGSDAFVRHFTSMDSPLYALDLPMRIDVCDNGYEAIKLTTSRNNCPIEMQFTHEASRQASRTGLGSHTLFKLEKLLGIGVGSHLSKEDIVTILNDTAQRKKEFNGDSLDIVADSKARAESLMSLCQHEALRRNINSDILGKVASKELAPVV